MSRYDVIVLGGGITGLVCAWKLTQAGVNTLLLEKDAWAGGVISTQRDGDWLMDTGPNSLSYKEGDSTHRMLLELGLQDEILSRPVRESDRYIWRGGMLRKVPTSPLMLLRKNAISRRMLTRAAVGLIRRSELPPGDISVGAYFSQNVGRAAVDQLLTPVLAGVYAADPFALSLEAVMPRLHSSARESRSLAQTLRAMKVAAKKQGFYAESGQRVLASFREGMHELPERVCSAAKSAGADVRLECAVTNVVTSEDGIYQIEATGGENFEARRIVCALPAPAAAAALQQVAPEASAGLGKIKYSPLALVHLGVKESDLGINYDGFGFLATRNSGVRSLGMIWSEKMFPGRAPAGHRLLTIFLGGQLDPGVSHLPDDALLEQVKTDVRTVMRWTGQEPEMARITRWEAAIPLLEVGHPERVREIKNPMPAGIALAGNYVSGVSVPACMNAAAGLASQLTGELG